MHTQVKHVKHTSHSKANKEKERLHTTKWPTTNAPNGPSFTLCGIFLGFNHQCPPLELGMGRGRVEAGLVVASTVRS